MGKAQAKGKAKAKAGANATRAPKVEPFFRPFEKFAADKKKKEKASAGVAPANAKAEPQKPVAPPVKPQARALEAPPAPVDPDTFAVYMAGVRALPEDGATRIPRTAHRLERAPGAAATVVEDRDADARARLQSLVAEGARFETTDDGSHLEGRRLDVDPRDLRRLRRGEFPVDGRLDLHGMNAGDARAALEAFVAKRAASGDVSVIVVHGRGTHSPRGVGVLRGEIGAWLTQGRGARHVRAFTSLPDPDGQSGAIVVLLAR